MNINSVKTFFLLLLMTIFFLIVGELLGGVRGMQIALILAIVTNFISYFFSDSMVLAAYKAKPVSQEQDPRLHSIVTELAMQAKIPVPKIYKINTNMPNAFATGRNPQHAAVAVTEGILRLLDDRELRGVLAHEISHVKNRDIFENISRLYSSSLPQDQLQAELDPIPWELPTLIPLNIVCCLSVS